MACRLFLAFTKVTLLDSFRAYLTAKERKSAFRPRVFGGWRNNYDDKLYIDYTNAVKRH